MKGPFKNHAGFGDTVAAVTQATGIRAIVNAGSKAFNKPAPIKYGLCIESTDRYSNLPGAETLNPQVLF